MNFIASLRQEITRIAKRESRAEVITLRKSVSQHRSHIAALKRDLAALAKVVREGSKPKKIAALTDRPTAKMQRFVPKGLLALRHRLGLSGEAMGKLIGFSPQSIYNWEQSISAPGEKARAKIATLRTISKREAEGLLEAGRTKKAK